MIWIAVPADSSCRTEDLVAASSRQGDPPARWSEASPPATPPQPGPS
jgi:hypothetical protein